MIPSHFGDPLPPVVTDMAEDLTFGERWLIVTDRRALLLSSDGEDGTIDLLLRDISAARLEQSVGGGCLALERTGCATILLDFSNSLVPKFAKVAEGIRQLCIGESPSLPTTMERSRCPQCGRLLPERNGSCPSCVKKLDTLRRIAGCLRPYWGKVALLVPIMATGALAEILPPVITQRIIDDALKPRADYTLLIWLVLGFLGVRFLGCVCEIGQRWLSIWLGSRMIADLRGQYYCHIQYLSLRFYSRSQLGMLLSRAIHDAGRLEEFLVQGLPSALTYGLMVGGILGLLFYENWVLTLYILLPIPPILLGTRLIWGRLMRDWGRVSTNWSDLFTHLSESISGIRVVKAFAQEGREKMRFDHLSDELLRASVVRERTWLTFFLFVQFTMNIGIFCIWYVGGRRVLGGEMTPGVLVAFITYLWMLYRPLQSFWTIHNSMAQALAGAARIFEILDTAPEPYNDPAAIPMLRSEGHVGFHGVTFGYDQSKPVLHEIDLDVAPGEMIGLVGRSGAGKTTAMNLLCRFYDVDQGKIAIDGLDIRTIDLKDLRRQIGIVLQDPFLLGRTIAENIGYGNPGASLMAMTQAAKAANAHRFIMAKPDGYDTQVGERGHHLSGGERQRIAIARTILRNPKILILDEATSSLDAESERSIQEAIGRLAKNRTTFIIAHRLSTLRCADRIAVLERGRVVEVGTREELMARKGIFYNLVTTQQEQFSAMDVDRGKMKSAVNHDGESRLPAADSRGITSTTGTGPEQVDPKQIRLIREQVGTLRLMIGENRSYQKVQPARVAPLSDPDHYISFLDEHGEEICMVQDPGDLDEATRRVLREELDRRYMTAMVQRIYSVQNELSVSYFDVQTNRGRREFVIQNIHESTRWLGERRLLLLDVDGNRFEIRDLDTLDKRSSRLLTIVL